MKVNIYEHEMVEIMVTIGIICIKHSEKITGKRIKRTRLRIMYNNKKKNARKAYLQCKSATTRKMEIDLISFLLLTKHG
jgi:hypothetical protein